MPELRIKTEWSNSLQASVHIIRSAAWDKRELSFKYELHSFFPVISGAQYKQAGPVGRSYSLLQRESGDELWSRLGHPWPDLALMTFRPGPGLVTELAIKVLGVTFAPPVVLLSLTSQDEVSGEQQ